MQCPECGSTHIYKHGKKRGQQNLICVSCSHQFIDPYDPPKGQGYFILKTRLSVSRPYLQLATQNNQNEISIVSALPSQEGSTGTEHQRGLA